MATPLYHSIESNKPLLRVGVMLDSWMVPLWNAEVLASVRDSGVAELTTVILNAEPPAKVTWVERVWKVLTGQPNAVRTVLWDLYVRIDTRLRPSFATPFKPTDVRSLLAGAKEFVVVPIRKGSVSRFDVPDIEAVKQEELDVILRFGFNIVRGDILTATRYGIWSYHHGDNNDYRGQPAGFWEMYERNPVTGTILQVLTEKLDGGRVIYRTHGATRSFESLLVNRYWLYRKAIPFVTRCLRRLYEHGPEGIRPEPEGPPYTRPIYRVPRNGQMIPFLARAATSTVVRQIKRLVGIDSGHWFLGLAKGVEPGPQLAGKVTPLHPPKGRFWADPILARRNDQNFIFFEDYDYRTRLGRISVVGFDEEGRPTASRTALETKYHLSYPFVFEWRGTHFMIPETASVRSVRLYQATEFPTRWEYVQDLLTDVRAVDATLHEHGGRWYLFTSISEYGGSSWDELFLFVSETPLGPWRPHPMNPIVSDVRCARPGGPLFRREGVVYRPGQNSERSYGQSLAVLEVTELTPERYSERLAYRIEPNWLPRIQGCHTITMAGDMMVLDCRTTRWLP